MSDDLPERLRNFPTPVTAGEIRLLQDAADEIERLRAALLDVYALIPPERVRLIRPHAQKCITEALNDAG